MNRIPSWLLVSLVAMSGILFTTSGCQPKAEPTRETIADEMPSLSPVDLSEGERLQVIATTSIVADVVGEVGRDRIDLTTLMPVGIDPHTFEPTPRDVAAVADAHVVFINGAGLEVFLEDLLESAGEGVTIVPVSYGVDLLQFEGEQEGSEEVEEHDHQRGEPDPHVWFDPNNVMTWSQNVKSALSTLDPGSAEAYEANAQAYKSELEKLDGWIRQQVAQIPEPNRKLVTDHASFGYFTHQYGFEQVGAMFPGTSTLAEPSAQDMAALENGINEFDVKAVFVGLTVNSDLAERIAEDTGTQLVFLYTGSLSEADGPAADYFSFMRYNVNAIVEALR